VSSVSLAVGVGLSLAVVLGLAGQRGAIGAWQAAGCDPNYAYAGAQDASPRSGIRATLTAMREPNVKAGHVSAWIGIGGENVDANSNDEWLQAGYVAFDNGPRQIYYEVTLPGKPPRYHAIGAAVHKGEKHYLAVLEESGAPGKWRVWLDGQKASPVIALPGSHGRFKPQFVGESWNAGSHSCNGYGYRFGDVQMATEPGGGWVKAKPEVVFRDKYNKHVGLPGSTFMDSSAVYTPPPPVQPRPLLANLASTLAGRPVPVDCITLPSVPVVPDPVRLTLLLSLAVCEQMLGFTVEAARDPHAMSPEAFSVAQAVLSFLRGVAAQVGISPDQVDCHAIGWFYRALRDLDATPGQATALRDWMLRRQDDLTPPLALKGCVFTFQDQG
jgi:hypothetical protein